MNSKINIGVLASGRGSNFAALLRHEQSGYFRDAHVACLISNVQTAQALQLAEQANIPGICINPIAYASAVAYETAIIQALDTHQVKWVILAGYMKIVGPTLLARYANRILNIHPSLLPSFPGLHAQRQALEHGVRVSGCTVHFVDDGMDTGPIIGQRAVEVLPADTEETLSTRILEQEHQLFAECLKAVNEQSWRVEGRRVIFD